MVRELGLLATGGVASGVAAIAGVLRTADRLQTGGDLSNTWLPTGVAVIAILAAVGFTWRAAVLMVGMQRDRQRDAEAIAGILERFDKVEEQIAGISRAVAKLEGAGEAKAG